MTSQEYLEQSARTDGEVQRDNFHAAYNNDPQLIADLIHGAAGNVTEAGELMDAVKKYLFYGKEIDRTNIKEEIGDCLWYLAKLCRDMGFSLDECMEANINKLKARYPNAFSNEAALDRDLDRERETLEDPGIIPMASRVRRLG